jgi:hypothetical protein
MLSTYDASAENTICPAVGRRLGNRDTISTRLSAHLILMPYKARTVAIANPAAYKTTNRKPVYGASIDCL